MATPYRAPAGRETTRTLQRALDLTIVAVGSSIQRLRQVFSLDQHGLHSHYRMGALDVYCAICGGPFAIPTDHLISSASSNLANKAFPPRSADFAWLRSLRVVARNTESGKAYITGSGHSENYGWVLVKPGNDANAPPPKRYDGVAEDMVGMNAYADWDGMGDGDEYVAPFPVHCACLEIMEKAHAVRAAGSVGRGKCVCDLQLPPDVERLRKAMQGLLQKSTNCLAGMNYYEFAQQRGVDLWEEGDEVRERLVGCAVRPHSR